MACNNRSDAASKPPSALWRNICSQADMKALLGSQLLAIPGLLPLQLNETFIGGPIMARTIQVADDKNGDQASCNIIQEDSASRQGQISDTLEASSRICARPEEEHGQSTSGTLSGATEEDELLTYFRDDSGMLDVLRNNLSLQGQDSPGTYYDHGDAQPIDSDWDTFMSMGADQNTTIKSSDGMASSVRAESVDSNQTIEAGPIAGISSESGLDCLARTMVAPVFEPPCRDPADNPPSPAKSAAPTLATEDSFSYPPSPRTPRTPLLYPATPRLSSSPMTPLLDQTIFNEMYFTMSADELVVFHAWLDDADSVTMPEAIVSTLDKRCAEVLSSPSLLSSNHLPPVGEFSPTPSKRYGLDSPVTDRSTPGTPRHKKYWMNEEQRTWLVFFYDTHGYKPVHEVARLFLAAFTDISVSAKTVVNACSRSPVLEARKRAELRRALQQVSTLAAFDADEDAWVRNFYATHGYQPIPDVWAAYRTAFAARAPQRQYFNFTLQMRRSVGAVAARKQAELDALTMLDPDAKFTTPKYTFLAAQTAFLVGLFRDHQGERELSVVSATESFLKAFPDAGKSAYSIKIVCSRGEVLEARKVMRERYSAARALRAPSLHAETQRRARLRKAAAQGRVLITRPRTESCSVTHSKTAGDDQRGAVTVGDETAGTIACFRRAQACNSRLLDSQSLEKCD